MPRRKTARKRRGGNWKTVRKGLVWMGKKLGSYGEYDEQGEFVPYDENTDLPLHLFNNYRIFHDKRTQYAHWRKNRSTTRKKRNDDAHQVKMLREYAKKNTNTSVSTYIQDALNNYDNGRGNAEVLRDLHHAITNPPQSESAGREPVTSDIVDTDDAVMNYELPVLLNWAFELPQEEKVHRRPRNEVIADATSDDPRKKKIAYVQLKERAENSVDLFRDVSREHRSHVRPTQLAPRITTAPLPLGTENKKAYVQIGKVKLYVEPVDLLDSDVKGHVIVDPASREFISNTKGAGGVSRSIYQKFGIEVFNLSKPDVASLTKMPDTMGALFTPYERGNETVRLIHAFGPDLNDAIYSSNENLAQQDLTAVYENVLKEFQNNKLDGDELLMPAISTGIFGSSDEDLNDKRTYYSITKACLSKTIENDLTVRLRVPCEMYKYFAKLFGLYTFTQLNIDKPCEFLSSKIWYEHVIMVESNGVLHDTRKTIAELPKTRSTNHRKRNDAHLVKILTTYADAEDTERTVSEYIQEVLNMYDNGKGDAESIKQLRDVYYSITTPPDDAVMNFHVNLPRDVSRRSLNRPPLEKSLPTASLRVARKESILTRPVIKVAETARSSHPISGTRVAKHDGTTSEDNATIEWANAYIKKPDKDNVAAQRLSHLISFYTGKTFDKSFKPLALQEIRKLQGQLEEVS